MYPLSLFNLVQKTPLPTSGEDSASGGLRRDQRRSSLPFGAVWVRWRPGLLCMCVQPECSGVGSLFLRGRHEGLCLCPTPPRGNRVVEIPPVERTSCVRESSIPLWNRPRKRQGGMKDERSREDSGEWKFRRRPSFLPPRPTSLDASRGYKGREMEKSKSH